MAQSKKSNKITAMLVSKGYDPNEDEVGTILEVEGKNYIITLVNSKKVFEEYTEELVEEEYAMAEEVKPVVEEEKPVEKVKKPRAKKEKVNDEDKPKKTKAKKQEQVVEEEKPEVVEEGKPAEKVKKPRTKKEKIEGEEKVKKPRTKKEKIEGEEKEGENKRKRRDPSKPKRPREKTCHNVFISDQMFELKKTEPEMTGRERFAKANEIWKNLDVVVKADLIAKFKANKVVAVEA